MPTITTVTAVQTLHAQAVTLGQQIDAAPSNYTLNQQLSQVLNSEADAVTTAALALLPAAQQAYADALQALHVAGAELAAVQALVSARDTVKERTAVGYSSEPVRSMVTALPMKVRGGIIKVSPLSCLRGDGVVAAAGQHIPSDFAVRSEAEMTALAETKAAQYLTSMRGGA